MPQGKPHGRWPGGREAMVAALSTPSAYPHGPSSVDVIETHISDLFLAGEYVFKVKKAVNFGFCDFSTLELRRHFTFRELELNRRLSPDVYLGVEEVRWSPGEGYFVTGEALPGRGPGSPQTRTPRREGSRLIEYALKMRRLPADRALDDMVRRGEAGVEVVEEIARRVAEFHKTAPKAPAGSDFGSPATIRDIVLDNMDRAVEHAERYVGHGTLADIRAFSEAFLDARRALFISRHEAGMVRDCHGDLHAANIFVEAPPDNMAPGRGRPRVQIIDCIEFSDRLRTIDPAADIAFLAMDLERLGRPDLSQAFTDGYVRASGDDEARGLLPFYMVYRAMVRCMTHALQADAEASQRYAGLAVGMAARERPLMLVLMTGTTGSGKSTVARLLAKQWEFVHFQTDVIRKRLAGLGPLERTGGCIREGIYSPEMSARTYREMERLAAGALLKGGSAIMDGTFLKEEHRAHAVRAVKAALLGAGSSVDALKTVIVECAVPESVQLARLESRYASGLSESEGRPEVYRAQAGEWEQVRDAEADCVVRLDTSAGERDTARQALSALWVAALSFKARGPAGR